MLFKKRQVREQLKVYSWVIRLVLKDTESGFQKTLRVLRAGSLCSKKMKSTKIL